MATKKKVAKSKPKAKKTSSATKAARTRKLRAAGKKAAVTKKRRAAAKKAVATRTRRAAAKKAVATKTRRAAARKAVATKRENASAKKPAPKKLHPRVESALVQVTVEGFVTRLPPPVQPIVNALRAILRDAAPEAQELLDDGTPAYFANGIFARIVPEERRVLVRFLKANELPSGSSAPGGELELTDPAELRESVLRQLVREAVLLNLSEPGAVSEATP